MPAASSRSTWKGAISFGLVHIPIELRSATAETRQSFKWIDPESRSAVGNQQVSKATGKAVEAGSVVKGIEVDEGQYVTLTKDEIRAALPKTTQTIEIEAFVDAGSIPAVYFYKPYHVAPSGKGQKAYELLRATLEKTGKVGLAKVVISTKQYFAALMPVGKGMVLNLMRWANEVRTMEGLPLPAGDVKPSSKEMQMAEMLVNDLAAEWAPDLFHDEFREQLQELIEAKTKAGNFMEIAGSPDDATQRGSSSVVDLTEMLKRSLERGTRTPPAKVAAKAANDGKVTPLRRAAAKKAPAKAVAAVKPPAKRKAG
ncbi:MAG: Ku protein [Polaromonas sp.]|nr:Ku protein [Polaromonas sp.]